MWNENFQKNLNLVTQWDVWTLQLRDYNSSNSFFKDILDVNWMGRGL